MTVEKRPYEEVDNLDDDDNDISIDGGEEVRVFAGITEETDN